MRRMFATVYVALAVLVFAAPPLSAAPLMRSADSTMTAPAAPHAPASSPWLRVLAGVAVFGSIANLKDPGSLAKKFVTRASAAQPDYQAGVAAAGSTWEQHTGASESAYDQGVQQAISKKRFASGVAGKASKYQTNASTLGAQRYPQGVAQAGDAWARGVAPAFNVLKSISLPPRGARRSPQNQQRSAAVQLALGALKGGS